MQLKINKSFLFLFIVGMICVLNVYAAEFPKVTDIKGKVKYQRTAEQWEDVKVGDVFEKGDRVKTASNSRCNLVMDKEGKQIVGIFANSEIIVLLDKKEKFELVNAEVLFSLEGLPEGSTFEVKTPTAVCGVRGTGFKIFSDTTMTQINAYYNSVYGKNFEGVVKDVPPGYFRKIDKNGRISKLYKFPDMEGKRFRAWKKSSNDKKEGKEKKKKDARSRNFRFEKAQRQNDNENVRGKSDLQNELRKETKELEKPDSEPKYLISPGPSEIVEQCE